MAWDAGTIDGMPDGASIESVEIERLLERGAYRLVAEPGYADRTSTPSSRTMQTAWSTAG
jgi:hypothetical protein